MPVNTTEFIVLLPRRVLWNLLNDFNALGKCVPGCEEVQVLSAQESRWKLKLSVGIVSKRIEARAQITERSNEERLVLKIDSIDGDISGTWQLNFAEETPSSTKVRLTTDMTARGSFEWVMNQIIKTQMAKMISQFVECVSKSN